MRRAVFCSGFLSLGLGGAIAFAQRPAATLPHQTTIDAADGPIVVSPFMHASVQIEHGGRVIQVDPAMGDQSTAKPADLVVVTDIHEDHLNPSRIARLRKPGAPVVVPDAVRQQAGDTVPAPVEVLANGQTKTVAGFAVEAVPMYNIEHKNGDIPFHTKGRGNGYVITVGGKRLYFAGDTECVPEIKALTNIDVAFLPMNLPFTMTKALGAVSRDQIVARFDDEHAAIVRLHTASANQPLGGAPIIVLTPANVPDPNWNAMQDQLAKLSSNASHRTVATPGGDLHLSEPSAVVRAVQDVSPPRGNTVEFLATEAPCSPSTISASDTAG